MDEKSRGWDKSDFKNWKRQKLEQKIFLFYDPRISVILKRRFRFCPKFKQDQFVKVNFFSKAKRVKFMKITSLRTSTGR